MELLIVERGEKMDGRHQSLLPVAPSATASETGRSEDNVLPSDESAARGFNISNTWS